MRTIRTALSSLSCCLLVACFGGQESEDSGTPRAPDAVGNEPNTLSDRDAVRFLQQASFGGSPNDISSLKTQGTDAWITEQVDLPIYPYQERVEEHAQTNWVSEGTLQALFWERAVHGDDQLRQRMAYALSQIVVASMRDPQLRNNGRTFSTYLDVIQNNALGNYCALIREVSLNPAMGLFLTHLGNPKADPVTGFVPDENYAREVMQLFTIGIEELDGQGRPQGREAYTGADVQGLAAVFTGLSWADTDFFSPRVTDFNRYLPMESFLAQHEDEPKTFLDTTVNLGNDAIISIEAALDHLLAHPNVAPFISKQLIQKLVTSNPSPAYVGRVAAAFEAGQFRLSNGTTIGSGQRCDLAATAAAILSDNEARSLPTDETAGKIRNPLLRLANLIRAFRVEQNVTRSGPIPSARLLDNLEDSDNLNINAFVSPSVFNFFRPGYVGPGTESAEAGLVTPEYQIATTPAMVGYINVMEDIIDGPPLSSDRENVAVMNASSLLVLSDNEVDLVAEIDRILTGGLMTDENRQYIEETVALVELRGDDIDSDRRRRIELALLMTVVSPEYMVQR
ncbi:MAG: DUF1800 family protein [Pseudomonadota bacterium]